MAEALVVCEERGDGFEAFAVRMFQGLARANQGRMSEGWPTFEQAEVFAARNGDRFWQPRLVSHAGLHPPRARPRSRRRASSTHGRWRSRARIPRPGRPRSTRSSTCASTTCAPATRKRAADLLAILEDGTRTRDWFRWMNELRRRDGRGRALRGPRSARGDRRRAPPGSRPSRSAWARATTSARRPGHGAEVTLAEGGDGTRRRSRGWSTRSARFATTPRRSKPGSLGARRAAAAAPGGRTRRASRLRGCGADSTRSSRGTDQPTLRESFLGSPRCARCSRRPDAREPRLGLAPGQRPKKAARAGFPDAFQSFRIS